MTSSTSGDDEGLETIPEDLLPSRRTGELTSKVGMGLIRVGGTISFAALLWFIFTLFGLFPPVAMSIVQVFVAAFWIGMTLLGAGIVFVKLGRD